MLLNEVLWSIRQTYPYNAVHMDTCVIWECSRIMKDPLVEIQMEHKIDI